MSIFGKHIAPKPNLLMTSFFRLQFWAFLDPTQKQKWPFWNPEIKLVQKHSFYSKIPIQKFAFLCGPRLSWPFSVIDLRGVRLQNGIDFWILRAKLAINHVPHARKIILILVTFVTFRDLILTLTSTLYDIYAHMVSLLANWGYFDWISSKRYRYCRS